MPNYLITIRTGNKNDQVSVEDYKGLLSINSTWEGNKGTQDNWIYTSEWKDGSRQPGDQRPLRIRLGDAATTCKILRQIIQAIESKPGASTGSQENRSPHLEPQRGLPGQTHPVTGDSRGAMWPEKGHQKPVVDDIPF